MINLSVKVDLRRLRAKLNDTSTKIDKIAKVRALNKIADQVKTSAAREIKKAGYNFSVSAIKSRIKIRKATQTNPVVVIRCFHKAVPLIEFSARQVSTGVSVNVKNGRKIIKGAFIATMNSSHEGVFIRIGDQHKRVMRNGKPRWEGLPIKQLYGPSVSVAFANRIILSTLESLVRDKYPKLLQHEIQYALSRR